MAYAIASLIFICLLAYGIDRLIEHVLTDDPDEERWDRFEASQRRDEVRQAAKDRL